MEKNSGSATDNNKMKKQVQEWIKQQHFPRNDADKQLILQELMKDFEENKTYKESEVNEIIKKHYDDFALIRRELINFRYMQRNENSEYNVVKKELSEGEINKIKGNQKDMEKGNVY